VQLPCTFDFYNDPSKGRKEVRNVRSALDRRQEILEALSDRRSETVQNLATEFGVSVRTIKYDLEILSCSAPIYTVQGNGGGVRVADGWYVSKRYLHDDQEALLRELMDGLQPDQQRIMQSILSSFAKPKVKESMN
jgi:predicted DNA-binding transcriptional regulator YafY